MSRTRYVLAIDQGTTSTRAVLFDDQGRPAASSSRELTQYYPGNGWVEHDAEEIWASVLAVCREAMLRVAAEAHDLVAIGVTNQRETSVLWDRSTGTPLHRAIVWQDRRTADHCRQLIDNGHEERIRSATGLVVDPYFSATKLAWLLDQVPGARAAAERGELAFGTIDCFLLWRLTAGRRHATDATNASRTMLFNLHEQRWDDDLCALFAIPRSLLPDICDTAGDFGTATADVLGAEVPVTAMIGDQQAALIGQACVKPGMIKCTYGTGAFVLMHTGDRPVASRNRLLTTVAYRLEGQPSFALEGAIFNAGTAVQWLRDGLKLIAKPGDSEAIAAGIASTRGVYLVPAFTGLGAPYWDSDARGAVVGLTRDSGAAEVVRAALEAVAYQTRDLLRAMADDGASEPAALRVDGGMVANTWLMQYLADIIGVPVQVPEHRENTVWGAAYLAGMEVGFYPEFDGLAEMWRDDCTYLPIMERADRDRLYGGWLKAVRQVRA